MNIVKDIIDKIDRLIKKINIDGVIAIGTIRNLIEKENANLFPTVQTTERPDMVDRYVNTTIKISVTINSPTPELESSVCCPLVL